MKYYQEKPNYRIYTLIIGKIIPVGEFFGCQIKKMTFSEQEQRKFNPIQSEFSEINDVEFYNTYATSLPYIDPLKIKSEYVIIYDIKEYGTEAALGSAIKYIDRICRFLTIAYAEDFKNKLNRDDRNLEPYLYQVNKIYKLDKDKNEFEIDFKLKSGHFYLLNGPGSNDWGHSETKKFLEEIFYFRDEILERAIKYLFRSSIGYFVNDSPEKIALDHIKSIEIIINSLSKKDSFCKRLKEAAFKINLSEEEKKKIIKCWDDRNNYSDTAHPAPFDQAERYPNQFPIPSNVEYIHSFHDGIAINVCIKYFFYKRSIFYIDIDDEFYDEASGEHLGEVNTQWESNHLFFETKEKNKKTLKQKVIKYFAVEYNIPETNIFDVTSTPGNKVITLRVKNYNKLHDHTLKNQKMIIWP